MLGNISPWFSSAPVSLSPADCRQPWEIPGSHGQHGNCSCFGDAFTPLKKANLLSKSAVPPPASPLFLQIWELKEDNLGTSGFSKLCIL